MWPEMVSDNITKGISKEAGVFRGQYLHFLGVFTTCFDSGLEREHFLSSLSVPVYWLFVRKYPITYRFIWSTLKKNTGESWSEACSDNYILGRASLPLDTPACSIVRRKYKSTHIHMTWLWRNGTTPDRKIVPDILTEGDQKTNRE